MTTDGRLSKKQGALLSVPVAPKDALAKIIIPSLEMLPVRMDSEEARVMMIAIALQESALTYRKQIKGPAKGFWQFEQGGGVKGVMNHPASKTLSKLVCARLSVDHILPVVYDTLEFNDLLAASYARLLLWTDPKPLPEVGDEDEAWDLYIRTWRPGKPHRDRWTNNYKKALEAL